MDSSTFWKLVIIGSLGGLGVWGFKWNWKKLKALEERKKHLKGQANPYTVSSLNAQKAALSTAGEFVMLDGTCLDIDSLNIKEPENRLKNIRHNNRLYTVHYHQSLENNTRQLEYKDSSPGAHAFALIDNIDVKSKPVIVVPGNSAQAANLVHHRKVQSTFDSDISKAKFYEKVSFIAFEGSSLTLLGLVKYDPKADELKMTDVSGFVAGGFKECKKIIMKEIYDKKALAWIFGAITGACFAICGFIVYSKYQQWNVSRQIRKQHQVEMERYNSIKRMPTMKAEEQGAQCLICMTNASNVVTIPCNHLGLCLDCFTQLKNRHDQGIGKFECPVCRAYIEPEKKILVSYKSL